MATDDELVDDLRRALSPLRPRGDLAATVVAAAAEGRTTRGQIRVSRRRRPLAVRVLGFGLSGVVVVAVAVALLAGHGSAPPASLPRPSVSASSQLAALGQSFSILRRWHALVPPMDVATARRRTTFLARKLKDDARVWLSTSTITTHHHGRSAHTVVIAAQLSPFGDPQATSTESGFLSELVVGSRIAVQPVSAGGPGGELDVEMVPDGVARVRWTATCTGGVPCADQHRPDGPVHTVLTVPVVHNLAAARIGTSPAGRGPVTAVTWLGSHGNPIARFQHVGDHTTVSLATATALTHHPTTASALELDVRGLGPLRFGAPIARVRHLLGARLGRPRTASTSGSSATRVTCGVSGELIWALTGATTSNPRNQTLELFFRRGRLVGYQDGTGSPAGLVRHPRLALHTARGLTVGDTLAHARALYGRSFHVSEAQDGSWSVGPVAHRRLDGYSTPRRAGTLNGRVLSIDAGTTGCPALSP